MTAAPMAPSGCARQNSTVWTQKPRRGSTSGRALARSMGGLSAMSAVPDPRVDPGVHDIHDEVHHDEEPRDDHDQRLDERVVPVGHRLHEQQAEPVEVEYLLGDHEPADEE